MVANLKINKNFSNVFPEYSKNEYLLLENSILDNGYINSSPIIVWNGFIVDGHKRYEICKKHNIEFVYTELNPEEFQTEIDIIKFIIDIHFSRRNLTAAQKIHIVYKHKDDIAKLAKERMKNGGKQKRHLDGEAIDTRAVLAKMAGVGKETLRQYEVVIKNGTQELINRMITGEKSIFGAYKEVMSITSKTLRKPISQKIKKIKIQESNSSCEICGCSIFPILEFHHIKMVSNGGNNDCENIKLICPNCHSLVHILEDLNDISAKQSLIDSLKDTQYKQIVNFYS